MTHENSRPRRRLYSPHPPAVLSDSEDEPEDAPPRPRCPTCNAPGSHSLCACDTANYMLLHGRPTSRSQHLVWDNTSSIPCTLVIMGPVGDAHVARIPLRELGNTPENMPIPSCIMVNTTTPIPHFAVVVACAPPTYTVRFFRDAELFSCGGDGRYDACMPLTEYRGGRLSSQIAQFQLDDTENSFEFWDGSPVPCRGAAEEERE